MNRFLNHRLSRLAASCFVVVLVLLRVSAVQAQTGSLSGSITESASGAPMPGVTVHAVSASDTNIAHNTYTNAKGKFRFKEFPPGPCNVTFTILGYQTRSFGSKVVSGAETTLDAELVEEPLKSEDVVVTASRRAEKVTDAPASVTVVSSTELREHINSTPTEALANVPGMDVSHEGMAMSTYASRSMHSVFGSDILTMNDYHSMEVPSIGGFYGILMPQMTEDIDHIEIVRGPGSALYGPEAATGVVHFISKSPFASQGTNLSIAGGERSYLDGGVRYAQALSNTVAFKVSGHYLSATDWELADDPKEDTARKYAQLGLLSPTLTSSQRDSLNRIGARDNKLEVYSFEARADAILSDNATLNITGGLTNIVNDMAMTEDFGDAQIKNWMYDFVQARVTYKDLFIQGAVNHNNTSGSYFLPTGAPIVNRSSTYVAQIQHRWDPMQNEKLTYGADYQAIRPISDSTIYGPDDGHANVSILGAYLQSQTSFFDNALELVLAGRLDKHSYLSNPIFSPRAALVYHLNDQHLLRAMYNETYLFPSENDMFADIIFSTDAYGFRGLPAPISSLPTTNIRYVSPYVSGTHFVQNSDGSYTVGSNVLGGVYNSNAAFWAALMKFAANAAQQPLLALVPAPANPVTYLAYLNLNTKQFVPAAAPIDVSAVQPQHQRSLEVDYQGALSKAFQYEIDGYQTHYTAIRASTTALTPNVFVDSAKTEQQLEAVFTANNVPNASAAAQQVAGQLYKLPWGVVHPSDGSATEAHPEDLLIGTRNYLVNSVEFYGLDASMEARASDDWSFTGSLSWLSKNYWYASELNSTDSSSQNPFALNIPKYRASIAARYSGLTRGLSVELRDRWSDAFKMNDSYWIGDVGARHVLDLTVNYRIESWNNLMLTLSVTNLLNNVHQELIGAPFIGRLAVLRAAYTLPSF